MDLGLLEKICQQCHLGMLQCRPRKLEGGFLHDVYALFTAKGRYVVKLLNPYIMQRETAMRNYRIAEKLELMLEEEGLPIIPALVFGNQKMQHMKGQFFYLYEWYSGKALGHGEIKETHCKKIGKLLARIHGFGRHEEVPKHSEIHIDWDFYIERLSYENGELSRLLAKNRTLLYESQNHGNVAAKKLPPVVSVCHNDMDSKNVLWAGTDCRVIDLECLSYASPFLELYDLALCWSGFGECAMDAHLFRCFLASYAKAGGCLPTDWESIYWGNYGRLEWLEYNLKRSLGMECSKEETGLGISQAKATIAQVIYYDKVRDDILANTAVL